LIVLSVVVLEELASHSEADDELSFCVGLCGRLLEVRTGVGEGFRLSSASLAILLEATFA